MSDYYSLNPALLIYPSNVENKRVFVAEVHSNTAPLSILDYRLLSALSQLDKKFLKEEFFQVFDGCNLTDEKNELFSVLLSEKVIVPTGLDAEYSYWNEHGWSEAYAYHSSTRAYPFVQMDTNEGFSNDSKRMLDYVKADTPPAPSVQRIKTKRISFVPLKTITNETIEKLHSESLTLEKLGLILGYCSGLRELKSTLKDIPFVYKSVPSGGGRHPSEIYLLLLEDLEEVKAGVYHYHSHAHALDCLAEGDMSSSFLKATFGLDNTWSIPKAAFLFASRVERAMWRYRDPRSARAILGDIGHIIMAWRTIIGALGLRQHTQQKFDDATISKLFSINPFEEIPLYVGTIQD